MFVDPKQVCTYVQISRMDRNVLRRKSLFDYALHFIFTDRGERGVVSVKEGETNIFILNKQRRSRINRVAIAEAEDACVGTLSRHDLLEGESEVFIFGPLEFQFPVVSTFLANFEHEFSFTGGVVTGIEVISHRHALEI